MADQSDVEQIYADGMVSISFQGGVFRLLLYQDQPGENDEIRKEDRKIAYNLVFHPNGFLEAFAAMNNLMGQLMQSGLVKPPKKRAPLPPKKPVPPVAPPPADQSPNFI